MAASSRTGRQRLGQHFLKSPGVLARIVAALDAPPGTAVFEVGPGRGALTLPLRDAGYRVIAIEKDLQLAEEGRLHFGPGVECLAGDALEFDFAAALSERAITPPVLLAGNLPYESATPMIRRFVRLPQLFSRLVVMVQKEVADRVAAPAGSAAYGFLSVDVGCHARAEKLFDVKPGAFVPPPKVVSAVLRLFPETPKSGASGVISLAGLGFQKRRKTLVNALGGVFDKAIVLNALSRCGWPPGVRAEELSIAGFFNLAEILQPKDTLLE